MAINYLIGRTQEDLERALAEAQNDLMAGRAIVQTGAGDTSSQSSMEKKCEDRIKIILKALHVIDPDKYPLDQTTAITETRVSFQYSGEDVRPWQ